MNERRARLFCKLAGWIGILTCLAIWLPAPMFVYGYLFGGKLGSAILVLTIAIGYAALLVGVFSANLPANSLHFALWMMFILSESFVRTKLHLNIMTWLAVPILVPMELAVYGAWQIRKRKSETS